MDIDRVDRLIRFIVLTAGQADEFRDRYLRPIHIIKYLYLADLAYAARNVGTTFTGVRWIFHHFGPWAVEAYERLEPALRQSGAERSVLESQCDDNESIRWTWQEDGAFRTAESQMPLVVSSAVRRAIREFGSDTYPLLHHVYRTAPMIHAAPEDDLDFSFAVPEELPPEDDGNSTDFQSLSKKKMKARKQRIDDLRAKVKAKFADNEAGFKMILPNPSPQYDEIFAEGQRWLDELAGGPVPESAGTLILDDSLWKHPSRTESDVP